MKPTLYSGTETEFTSNGLGKLNPIRCIVTEERNGQFELEMDIDIADKHYPDISEGKLIFAPHDDTLDCEPFEIYKISRPLNGVVTINAWHISYRTAKMTVMPFTAASCAAAVVGIGNNIVGTNPFTFTTDITTQANFSVDAPETVRNKLGGTEGSLLDAYGGEFEWNKFAIRLKQNRGTDTGVVLRYGKNITELTKVTDSSGIWTGICPYWYGVDPDTNTEALVTLSEKVLYSSYVNSYSYRMVIPMDFTGDFESKPTESQLRTRARAYITANAPTSIPTSIDVSFVQLWQTQEYENIAALERLKLCDTLTVKYEKLGVSNTAKIIKTEYDVLLERYESMTIGDVRSSLGETIRAATDEIKSVMVKKSDLQRALDAAANLIQGGLGGHVVINTSEDGKPNEILIMDTESTATAVKVLRINMNGIGFSKTGYNGPFTSAWTLDGAFVADFITSGTLNANIIKAGTLADTNKNTTFDLSTGALDVKKGSINLGSGKFSVDSNGNLQAMNMTAYGSLICYESYTIS